MLRQFTSEVISILGAGEKTTCKLLDLGVGVGRATEVGVRELRVFMKISSRFRDHAGIYSVPQILMWWMQSPLWVRIYQCLPTC